MYQIYRPRLRALLLRATVLASLSMAVGAQPVPPSLKATIEQNTAGKVRVEQITASPIPGIYQVVSEGEIFYTDASGRFGFVGGAMVDMKTQQDLTAPQLEKLNSVPFASLPLKHAIKEVHGNGKRQVAVFEDPQCPICRVFTKFVDQLDDVTVYRFMFPVISPESAQFARAAWCSPNRAEAWQQVMAGRRLQGREDCDTSGLVEILKFGERHRIQNTPTVILGNGKRLVGATPPEQFIAELDASVSIK
ncbi:DsbC family protein [Acidovorax sp. SUPP2825]|uniref:DsbC family protein n=1 Tax=Acidovorax sp. SUPP2825 TaxID=2920879 RepID=UPI0023DE59FA|nr:DsbC family protein [Acidovorax sp. SUPP2825]GKS97701.1 DsbC family protein [Acidovorax sp. SUPP2825]